ncbi:MAG: PEP-CTERM sorting domain-containing protein [Planctomycetota bacterium]
MLKNIPLSAAVAATFGLAAISHAATLASDSFIVGPADPGNDAAGIYTVGSTIEGTNPDTFGFGPTNNWGADGGTYVADAAGLTINGLGGGGAVIATNTAGNFDQSGRLITADASAVTDSLFVGVLMNRSETMVGGSPTGLNEFLTSAFLGRVGSEGGGPMEFGIIGDDFGVNVNTTGGNVVSRTTGSLYTADTTVLLVLRVDINDAEGDDDNWSLFAFNEGDTILESATPVLTGTAQLWDADTNFGPGAIRFVENEPGTLAGTTSFTFDEFRVGTTFESVVPIPEPTAALSVLGGLGMLGMRRRQR